MIFKHSVKPGDWKGGVMREPPEDWVTYEARNEVGSHRRSYWGLEPAFIFSKLSSGVCR